MVITDLSLTAFGGLEFVQAIQRINPEIQCIVLADYSDQTIPSDVLILVNPISNLELVDSIRNTLSLLKIRASEEAEEQISFDRKIIPKLQVLNYNNIRRHINDNSY